MEPSPQKEIAVPPQRLFSWSVKLASASELGAGAGGLITGAGTTGAGAGTTGAGTTGAGRTGAGRGGAGAGGSAGGGGGGDRCAPVNLQTPS